MMMKHNPGELVLVLLTLKQWVKVHESGFVGCEQCHLYGRVVADRQQACLLHYHLKPPGMVKIDGEGDNILIMVMTLSSDSGIGMLTMMAMVVSVTRENTRNFIDNFSSDADSDLNGH